MSAATPSPAPSGTGMAQNVAGLLAYVTLIPAIIFLVAEPYKNNKFIKFHAWQNIFLAAAVFVLWIGLFILGMVLAFAGPVALIMLPINLIVWLGILVAWIMCMVKAYGNNVFKLPIIGNLAAKQAGL